MLVFQWLLLAGYAYAHLVTRWLPPARRGLPASRLPWPAGLALLPILPGPAWKPTGGEEPWTQVVRILLASVGGPFFVLSTTGPLVQAWFARPRAGGLGLSPLRRLERRVAPGPPQLPVPRRTVPPDRPAVGPLVGGLRGLLSCAGASRSRPGDGLRPRSPPRNRRSPRHSDRAEPAARSRSGSALGMVPSVLMLATTNQVCADIALSPSCGSCRSRSTSSPSSSASRAGGGTRWRLYLPAFRGHGVPHDRGGSSWERTFPSFRRRASSSADSSAARCSATES